MKRSILCSFGLLAAACSTPAARPPVVEPPTPPSAWCAAVPHLTEDASGDETGRQNRKDRALRVLNAADKALFRCPGVTGIGLSTWMIASTEHAQPPPGRFDADASYVIRVYVRGDEHLPPGNPMYLDGVQVWFTRRVFAIQSL